MPNIIPIMTVLSVVMFITATLAFWPVWGWFTWPIMIMILNGYLNAIHLVPNNYLGSIVFIGYMVVGITSWRFIPHSGHLHDL